MSHALDSAVEALMREAVARAILPHYRQLAADQIDAKAANDVVTIADYEAEAILSDGLARLLPDALLVGEEAAHADPAVLEHLGAPLCWIVDPLDGTNNFAAGKPPFGVLVALAQDGEAVAGWILDALTGRFCRAAKGHGAFIDGERIAARSTGEVPPVAANSLVYLEPERRAAVQAALGPHYQLVDIPRCAAEQYPRLALGQNDVAIFERTLAWDHAAGVLFLGEAGGKAARPDGSAYRVDEVDRRGLIGAASPGLWDDMAALLATV